MEIKKKLIIFVGILIILSLPFLIYKRDVTCEKEIGESILLNEKQIGGTFNLTEGDNLSVPFTIYCKPILKFKWR